VIGSTAGQSGGTVTWNCAWPPAARTRRGKARSKAPALTTSCRSPATASRYATYQEASGSESQDCIFVFVPK